ncbi:sensor histidine kinase [Paenibacillus roseipurpureus]|uniref:Sensor histidine kinase n=1 Tax=Paenibacillus roseopurpureus TaxID=2918901 RepID=A0AA96RIK2_9BACL|nr:sensor histidine kinase [Paenibacillus sp. MBLB1832]WNR42905.1 sensor histidine kinase [Paenibacillus sp. MBLB1832]
MKFNLESMALGKLSPRFGLSLKLFIMLLVLVTVIILLVGLLTQRYMGDLYERQQIERVSDTADKMADYMDLMAQNVRQTMQALSKSPALYGESDKAIWSMFQDFVASNTELVYTAYFIWPDGHVAGYPYGYWEVHKEPMIAQLLQESKDKYSIWQTIPYNSQLSGPTLTFAMNVDDPVTQKNKGILAFNINLRSLEQKLDYLTRSSKIDVALYTREYFPLAFKAGSPWMKAQQDRYIPNEALAASWEREKDQYQTIASGLVFKREIASLKWNMLLTVDNKDLFSALQDVRFTLIYIFLGAFIWALGVALYISRYFSKPITSLVRHMGKDPTSLIESPRMLERYDEIGRLSSAYNRMIQRINDTTLSLLKGEQEKKELEMRALAAQMNPHFLQNTLTSILWSVKLGKVRESEEMIVALSDILTFSMDKVDAIICLRDELIIAKAYIHLQQIRYPKVFEWKIDVNEELQDIRMPKMTLQPLIENAIFHGLMPRQTGGNLRISAERCGTILQVTVSDNGVGMTPKQQQGLFEKSAKSHVRGLNKLGVYNVDERLKLEYGFAFGLQVSSEMGAGTQMKILIPMEVEAKDA